MDVMLQWDARAARFDLPAAGLCLGNSVQAALESRLFTDRLAEGADVPPGEDRRGWAGDRYHPTPGPLRRVGSRLWVLRRRLVDEGTLTLVRHYMAEALEDLIMDRVEARFDIRVWRSGVNTIAGYVRAYAQDGRVAADLKFDDLWQDLWQEAQG